MTPLKERNVDARLRILDNSFFSALLKRLKFADCTNLMVGIEIVALVVLTQNHEQKEVKRIRQTDDVCTKTLHMRLA